MNIENYHEWVGKKVHKCTGSRKNREPKPFKSQLKVNTVKALSTNLHTGKIAFTFVEDDSVVDCRSCFLKD